MCSLPGPPSSQPPSWENLQVSRQHTSPACAGAMAGGATAPGGGGDGIGGGGSVTPGGYGFGGGGDGFGGGGLAVPGGCGVGGGGVPAGGGQFVTRMPQSSQSDPTEQHRLPLQVCSEPGPPSSHSPSPAYLHELSQHWDAARPMSRLSASTNDSNDRMPVVRSAGSGMGRDVHEHVHFRDLSERRATWRPTWRHGAPALRAQPGALGATGYPSSRSTRRDDDGAQANVPCGGGWEGARWRAVHRRRLAHPCPRPARPAERQDQARHRRDVRA